MKSEAGLRLDDDKVVTFSQFGLPNDEELVEYYACALWSAPSYRPGWMYISSNYVSFSSAVFENKLSFKFRDLSAIKKGGGFIQDGIELVVLKAGQLETYSFSAFISRDAAFKTLESLWKVMMSQVLKVTEVEAWAGTMITNEKKTPNKERLSHTVSKEHILQSMPKNLLHELMKENEESRRAQDTSPRRESPDVVTKGKSLSSLDYIMEEAKKESKIVTSSMKYIIEKQSRNELIYGKFRMPSEEAVIKDWNVEFWYQDMYLEGWLFVTPNFFLFGCPTLKFIVPWDNVNSITKQNTLKMIPNAIEITAHRKTADNKGILTKSFFFVFQQSTDHLFSKRYVTYILHIKV